MKNRTALLGANLKAFLAGWLTASLLLPLLNVITGTGYGYFFGLMLMLLGLVSPYMLLPCLGAVAMINLVAYARQQWFAHPVSCVLLCGILGSAAFLLFFMLWHLMRGLAGASSFEGLLKIAASILPAATLFGVYYYLLVVPNLTGPEDR